MTCDFPSDSLSILVPRFVVVERWIITSCSDAISEATSSLCLGIRFWSAKDVS